jgi:hypothetical protein
MPPPHLRPPLGFHITTFVGAVLSVSYCGCWPLVAWGIATAYLSGLFDGQPPTRHDPPPQQKRRPCNRRNDRGRH